MEINKVVYNGDTLLDLTSDTVTPQTLLSGATAHAANGQSISGTVDLNGKADKVANATVGNFAGLDANGNLTDSSKSAADFATASDMSDVQGVIPSTATTQNKLATAADVTGEDISSTSTTSPVSTASGNINALTVYGKSRTSKNLLEITAESQTVNGVTFTVNKAAGTITANGTATSLIYFTISNSCNITKNGNYIITWYEPLNVDSYFAFNNVAISSVNNVSARYNNLPEGTYQVFYRVPVGATLNNVTRQIRICTVADYEADPTFEPYFEGIKSVGEGWATVDLGTLNWEYSTSAISLPTFGVDISGLAPTESSLLCALYTSKINRQYIDGDMQIARWNNTGSKTILITNSNYTDPADFKAAMSGVILCYQLADPTQGNTIAVKTDDGTGIDGTMATFTTALPLCGVSDTLRDKLTCTADAKQVETVCGEVDLGDLTWEYLDYVQYGYKVFRAPVSGMAIKTSAAEAISGLLCENYPLSSRYSYVSMENKSILRDYVDNKSIIVIKDADYTDATTFKAAMSGVMLVYELAEPVTTPLTDAEISAFRGLRTYTGTTNITITDSPDFEFNYLKNTENGKAVADIQRELQEQIDEKITISPQLTLTVAGWDSTTLQQTVTFVHDTTKRNVIDVDPASVEEWAACGIIARYETASNITFTCKSIPENALSFKVTSMGV